MGCAISTAANDKYGDAKIQPSDNDINPTSRNEYHSVTSGTSTYNTRHWIIKNDDWHIFIDENSRAYYCNSLTNESLWEPPTFLQNLEFPEDATKIIIDYFSAVPGFSFETNVQNVAVEVLCPVDFIQDTQIALLKPQNNNNVTYTQKFENSDTLHGPSNEHANTADNNLSRGFDYFSLITQQDSDTLETDVQLSKSILVQVAEGNYVADLIFQLSWAYRVKQFEDAVMDCYRKGEDFFDSSKYDNCDGIPRYEEFGMLEWWLDLRKQKDEIDQQLNQKNHDRFFEYSDIFYKRTKEEYEVLEASALSGDDATFLSGLLRRKEQVETELNNLTARALAIVSIDGGPTKESLEIIHTFLGDCFHDKLQIEDLQDEMEEVVSNAIEPRHKFVVDLILNMVSLESELEDLIKRIAAFQTTASISYSISESDVDSVQRSQEDSIEDMQFNQERLEEVVDDFQDLLSKEIEVAADITRSINERCDNDLLSLSIHGGEQKELRVTKLMEQNKALMRETAEEIAKNELKLELLNNADDLNANSKEEIISVYEAALLELRRSAEEHCRRLEEDLEYQKQLRLERLRARLAKKKEELQYRLSEEVQSLPETFDLDPEDMGDAPAGILRQIDLLTKDAFARNAAAVAAAETESAEEAERIEKEGKEIAHENRSMVLTALKMQHEMECERLELELANKKERDLRVLRDRIDLKRKLTTAKSESSDATLQTLQQEKERETCLLEATFDMQKGRLRKEISLGLREVYDKELSRMEVFA